MNFVQIKNYEHYLIYDDGKVFNTKTQKFLKGSIGENGYQYFRLSLEGKKKMFYVHRLVAEHFLDNPNNLPVVNHKDGNKLNNKVDNLEWVTYSENTQHWKDTTLIQRKKTEYYSGDLPDENWKEFNNYYVSNKGRIRHKVKNNLLSPSITCGYYKVRLSYNGLVSDYLVHKLVYQLFSENYDETKIIDHIDGNKLNNDINNLRQLTLSENALAALYETKTNSSAKKVYQYSLKGELLGEYLSTREAAKKLNLDSSTISKVCRGKNKSHGGFIFRYSKIE